jgi:hypothetical protein
MGNFMILYSKRIANEQPIRVDGLSATNNTFRRRCPDWRSRAEGLPLVSYGIDIDKTLSIFHYWLKSFTTKCTKGTKKYKENFWFSS